MVGDRMRATCAADMNKMGLEVISFTIKEVRDKNEYIANMGRPTLRASSVTPMWRPPSQARRATPPLPKPSAIRRSEAAPCANRPSRAQPIRSACSPRRYRWRSRRKRSAISKSRRPSIWKPSSGSRRRPISRYEIQTNVMQQQVVAEQVKIHQIEKEHEIKVQDAEIQRRERELIATVLKGAEIERRRIETLARPKAADHLRSRRPRVRDPRAGRSRSRDHLQEGRSRSQAP